MAVDETGVDEPGRYLNHAHAAHVIQYGLANKPNMHCHTVVRTQACSYQQSNAYFEGISLESVPFGFDSLLSIDALVRENLVSCPAHACLPVGSGDTGMRLVKTVVYM